jgi:hypothetical protein
MSINKRKEIKEQKLVEKSDNKLTETLFSNNPHVTDKSSNINVVKIGKNKFVSIIKSVIIDEKNVHVKHVTKIINKHYDLNDFDYDFEYSDFEDKHL